MPPRDRSDFLQCLPIEHLPESLWKLPMDSGRIPTKGSSAVLGRGCSCGVILIWSYYLSRRIMKDDLVERLRKRAEIRRQIDTRKSVQNNEPDRIADLLEEAADQLEKYTKVLEEIANDYPELSHDKARMQNLDHIKWAKAVLKEIK